MDTPLTGDSIEPISSTEEGGGPKDAFRIEQLFGSRTRARLLSVFLENADRAFYVRELARRVDAQINAVRRELKNLLDIGIVIEGEDEGEVKDKEHKRFYRANAEFPLFEDLKGVMKKAAVLMNRSLLETLKKAGPLDLVILTGKFTESANIPTDILIVGDLSPEAVQQAISDFEKEIGREVNYTFMPRDEFRYRSDVGDRFLASLLTGKRIVLHDVTRSV
jgi:predicted transcriptional regulator